MISLYLKNKSNRIKLISWMLKTENIQGAFAALSRFKYRILLLRVSTYHKKILDVWMLLVIINIIRPSTKHKRYQHQPSDSMQGAISKDLPLPYMLRPKARGRTFGSRLSTPMKRLLVYLAGLTAAGLIVYFIVAEGFKEKETSFELDTHSGVFGGLTDSINKGAQGQVSENNIGDIPENGQAEAVAMAAPVDSRLLKEKPSKKKNSPVKKSGSKKGSSNAAAKKEINSDVDLPADKLKTKSNKKGNLEKGREFKNSDKQSLQVKKVGVLDTEETPSKSNKKLKNSKGKKTTTDKVTDKDLDDTEEDDQEKEITKAMLIDAIEKKRTPHK